MLHKSLVFIFIIIFLVIILPVLALRGVYFFQEEDKDPIMIKVYNVNEDKIEEMELEKYLIGVVAAEMPANYHAEALKAQAVAARTYALRHIPEYGGSGSKQYPGAHICTDFRYSQAWISEAEMKEKWGFLPYFYLWNRISQAVEDTRGEVLVYKNKLIEALYHSNAGGRTESAHHVWGNRVPYLKSVPSPYDKESNKNYQYTFQIPITVFDRRLETNIEQIIEERKGHDQPSLREEKVSEELFKVMKRSESGRVLQIDIGGKVLTGNEVRQKLSLPSNDFEFEIKEEVVFCQVIGNGHGVGMSQAGANGFAQHGHSYNQILTHYYPGVKIVDIKKLNN